MSRFFCRLWLIVLPVLVAGCVVEPERVVETVVSEVEVTREIETVREVEVTRIVQIETIRELTTEVTREVEVTRLVEFVVTATAPPTPLPTPTSIPPTAAPPTASSSLLQTMRSIRTDLEEFGGLIDTALSQGSISCQRVVDLYDRIAAAPSFNVVGAASSVQSAHASYRTAIGTFSNGARDMAQNCRDFLSSSSSGTTIPYQQWGSARVEVNEALELLIPAIRRLEN